MSQDDLIVSNQTFPATRTDINSNLQALGSLMSGASAPGTTYAYMWWADTTNGVLKQRNAGDSAWVIRATLSDDRVVTKTTTYTVVAGDYDKLILCSASGAAFTVNLTAAATLGDGFRVKLKKTDATANAVTIDGNASETIEGAATKALSTQYDCVTLVCDGSNWFYETSTVNSTAISGATIDNSIIGGTTPAAGTFTSINAGQLAGFRNKIINGDFRYWRYGTTYALTTSSAYGSADRWASKMNTSAAGIFNRDTSITAALGFQYNAKVGRNNGSALTNQISLYQAIETINTIPLAGKVCTFSFYAKAGANFSGTLNAQVITGTGTDEGASGVVAGSWTGNTSPFGTSVSLTTSWQRFQYTGTIASNVLEAGVLLYYVPVGTAGADDNFYVTGLQLETGPVATPFEDRGATMELALCSRYLQHFNFPANETLVGFGAASGTNTMRLGVPFTVDTRIAPTSVVVSAAASFSISRAAGSTVCSSVTLPANTATKKVAGLDFVLGSSPLTLDFCYFAVANTAASFYFPAEL